VSEGAVRANADASGLALNRRSPKRLSEPRPELAEFRAQFAGQFGADAELGQRVNTILSDFIREATAPGYLL
jgi:hypothetical protein